MKPAMAGKNSLTPQRAGYSKVREKAPGPTTKTVNYKNAPPSPNSGQTSKSVQRGYTSPMTDSGGGMGNDCAALHRRIIGK